MRVEGSVGTKLAAFGRSGLGQHDKANKRIEFYFANFNLSIQKENGFIVAVGPDYYPS
jgi:hypothetical protein